MDWQDELKKQATDKAQSKAVDAVAKSQGDTAASVTNDSIEAAKAGDPKILAQKQKLAAQQRAREVAERKYAEGKTSAANKVADQYGNTAGQAAGEAIDAARNGDMKGFEDQQKASAKDRAQDTAERKLEEQLSGNSVAKAQQAATMSAEEKRELLKDMDIAYTSKQTQTQEEMLATGAAPVSMSADEKRDLLKDMDISYTSTQVQSQDEMLSDMSAGTGADQVAPANNTPPIASAVKPASPTDAATSPAAAAAASSEADAQKPPPKKPTQAPMGIGSLNTVALSVPVVKYLYQFDIDAETAKNDVITLKHNESDWTSEVKVADLKEIDTDWVELVFRGLPESGTFDLLQDPKDGEDPFYIFYDVAYEDLNNITPLAEAVPPFAGEVEGEEEQTNATANPTQQ